MCKVLRRLRQTTCSSLKKADSRACAKPFKTSAAPMLARKGLLPLPLSLSSFWQEQSCEHQATASSGHAGRESQRQQPLEGWYWYAHGSGRLSALTCLHKSSSRRIKKGHQGYALLQALTCQSKTEFLALQADCRSSADCSMPSPPIHSAGSASAPASVKPTQS